MVLISGCPHVAVIYLLYSLKKDRDLLLCLCFVLTISTRLRSVKQRVGIQYNWRRGSVAHQLGQRVYFLFNQFHNWVRKLCLLWGWFLFFILNTSCCFKRRLLVLLIFKLFLFFYFLYLKCFGFLLWVSFNFDQWIPGLLSLYFL